jgi:hypothetical protein
MIIIVFWAALVLPAFSQQNALPDIEEVVEYTDSGIPSVIERFFQNAPEHVLVGVGTGKLSTLEASMEQAKFNAHADLCGQVWSVIWTVKNSIPDVPKSVVDRLDFYQEAYYAMVSNFANNAAAFDLYGLTTIERRLRTKDGMIWYVVTLDKNKTENQLESLKEHVKNNFESIVEDWEESAAEGMSQEADTANFSVPAVVALDALERMEAAFNEAADGSPASAGGTSRARETGIVPAFVNEAYLNASEDVFIGVGVCETGGNAADLVKAKAVAETMALADISRQVSDSGKGMIIDYYAAAGSLDPDAKIAALENIIRTLGASGPWNAARTLLTQTDSNGLLWVVMEYSRSAAREGW